MPEIRRFNLAINMKYSSTLKLSWQIWEESASTAMSVYSLDGLRGILAGIKMKCPLFVPPDDEKLVDLATEEVKAVNGEL